MFAAVQALAPALLHRAVLSMNWSLITVAAMLDLSTQTGTSNDAGCWLPATPCGGEVVPLTRPVGGVCPARSTVARATASCASRYPALQTEPHGRSGKTLTIPSRVASCPVGGTVCA